MAGLFSKAKEKNKSTQGKPRKKATTWMAGDPEGDKIAKSLSQLRALAAEQKALDAKMKIHKQVVHNFANASFVSDFADMGVMPETPMKVVNSEGDAVTFVVQDRGGQYAVKDEQVEDLEEVLGEEAAHDLLYTETSIGLSREVMAIPGVAEHVEKALESALRKMLKSEILDEEMADELVQVKEKRAFKPGTLARAASLVGGDKTRLGQFLDAMSSGCIRYVKC